MHAQPVSGGRMSARMVSAILCLGLLISLGVVTRANKAEDSKEKESAIYDGAPGKMTGDVRINPKDGAEMVWVPAGEFLMGGTKEQVAAAVASWTQEARDAMQWVVEAETPQRRVYLDGYWIYRYPVTVAQYRKFCEATGRGMPAIMVWVWKDDHPMVRINWQDASDYAEWAGVSLPTEAQWEKAARGTDGRIFPWGNEWDATRSANGVERYLTATEPVGSHPTGGSPYGAMDMSGNVWEWCSDWYDPQYYRNAPSRNPTGPSRPVQYDPGFLRRHGTRVLRGGSWGHGSGSGSDPHIPRSIYHFQCSARYSGLPDHRSYTYGFRCVGTP